MKLIRLVFFAFTLTNAFSQEKPVGIFQDYIDVGSPKKTGSAQYDAVSQTYTIKGAGYNIWYEKIFIW